MAGITMAVSFGLERVGLVSQKHPRAMLTGFLIVTILFLFGATNLQLDSSIRDIFRSQSPEYAVFEEVTRQYPGRENDVMLMIEGDGILTPERLESLSELTLELMVVDGVENVLSMFQATHLPTPDTPVPAPIIPQVFEPNTDIEKIAHDLKTHPLVSNKLLSEDGSTMLMVVALQDVKNDLGRVKEISTEIRTTTDAYLQNTPLKASMTGIPVIRTLLLDVLNSDQLIFRFASYAISILLAWLFFRNFRYLVLAILPPFAASIWLLGGMGWAGRSINVITHIVPTLVMVITFSNAIHFLLAIRRYRTEGDSKAEAITRAVIAVGPASVLTSLTTAIALLSLTIAGQPAITTFATTAAYGTALAFITVLAIIPALATLLLKEEDPTLTKLRYKPELVSRISALAATSIHKWAKPIAAIGTLVVVIGGVIYFQNTPRFLYIDHLPRNSEAFYTAKQIDKKLSGTSTIRVFLQWPDDFEIYSPEMLDIVQQAHRILDKESLVRQVWSLHSFEDWQTRAGKSRQAILQQLSQAETDLSKRFIREDHKSALISGQMPDSDASVVQPMLSRLDAQLDALRRQHPDVKISLTGIAAQSARSSYEIIGNLSISLVMAIVLIIGLIGFLLKSATIGFLSIMPNLLPLTVVGSFLFFAGKGLQFNSIIALTVGFGIAVDSTIHMLNHYSRNHDQIDAWKKRLDHTIKSIGPALIVSTLALMTGGVTMLSPMPTSRLYGLLSVMVLATALIGDLLLLPASIWVIETIKAKRRKK